MSKFSTLTVPFPAFFVNFRSWSMVKQCVDATYQDIRKREVLSELQLRIFEVQCSAPVMWITPSKRISHGFPMVISRDSCHTMTSPLISANGETSPNRPGSHLSLYVSCISPLTQGVRHCAYIIYLQGDRRLRMRIQNRTPAETASISE